MDSRTVFVGNIPYEGTEAQLIEVFSEVGKVVNFRLVSDKTTGKPKGFGFCEFSDAETAKSAIRNLNNRDFHGRSLRVDYADDDKPVTSVGSSKPGQSSQRLSVDGVTQIVNSLSDEEQSEILAQMKVLIQNNPSGTRQFLSENQQLAQALLRVLVNFDAVKPSDVQSLNVPKPTPTGPINRHPVGRPPNGPPPRHHPPSHAPMPHPEQPFPPRHHTRPPPAQAPLPQNQQETLQRVLSLTPEQIAALPPEAQAQVRAVRSKLMQHQQQQMGMAPPSGRRYP